MGAVLYQNGPLLTLLSNFCQVAMLLYFVFLQKYINLTVCKNFTEKMTWNHGTSYKKKTLKINITMGYTSVFTTSVLKAS